LNLDQAIIEIQRLHSDIDDLRIEVDLLETELASIRSELQQVIDTPIFSLRRVLRRVI
jgi:hypothetical protein